MKFLLNFNGHKHFKCEKSEIISSVVTQRTNNFQFNDKCKNKERRRRNETKIQCIKLKMENQFIRLRNFRRMTIMYPFSVCFVFFFFSVGFICSSMSSGVRLALFCIFDRCTSNRVLSCLWKIVFDIYFFSSSSSYVCRMCDVGPHTPKAFRSTEIFVSFGPLDIRSCACVSPNHVNECEFCTSQWRKSDEKMILPKGKNGTEVKLIAFDVWKCS